MLLSYRYVVEPMLMNRSMPPSPVIPELAYPDVIAAVSWLSQVFGFTLRLRIATHRAQMNASTGAIVLTGMDPAHGACVASSVMVRVENVDDHYAQVCLAGGEPAGEPVTYPYGERQYNVKDLAGHRWTFSQTMADVDPETWGGESV